MLYCNYYQARVCPKECWFLTGILRSFEHLAFDRTIDAKTSTFEFFVPEGNDEHFVQLMHYFEKEGIVTGLIKMPNRLLDPSEVF